MDETQGSQSAESVLQRRRTQNRLAQRKRRQRRAEMERNQHNPERQGHQGGEESRSSDLSWNGASAHRNETNGPVQALDEDKRKGKDFLRTGEQSKNLPAFLSPPSPIIDPDSTYFDENNLATEQFLLDTDMMTEDEPHDSKSPKSHPRSSPQIAEHQELWPSVRSIPTPHSLPPTSISESRPQARVVSTPSWEGNNVPVKFFSSMPLTPSLPCNSSSISQSHRPQQQARRPSTASGRATTHHTSFPSPPKLHRYRSMTSPDSMFAIPSQTYQEHKGKTALHLCAERGNSTLVQFLLDNKVEIDVDQPDAHGRTALHLAVTNGHLDIVSKLLNAGADTDILDYSGFSPIHTAAEADMEDIFRLLTREGADLSTGIGS